MCHKSIQIPLDCVRIPLTLFTVVLLGIWTPGTEIDRGVPGSEYGQTWHGLQMVGLR